MDGELRPTEQEKSADERIAEMAQFVSLKDMPLEERRKEANKPLYLVRYE